MPARHRVHTGTQCTASNSLSSSLTGYALPCRHVEALFLQSKVRSQPLLATLGRLRQAFGYCANQRPAHHAGTACSSMPAQRATDGVLKARSCSQNTQASTDSNTSRIRASVSLGGTRRGLGPLGRSARIGLSLLHGIVNSAFYRTCALGSTKPNAKQRAASSTSAGRCEH